MSIRGLVLVGVSTFALGVLMQPVIFPKPPQKIAFVAEGHADKVQNPSKNPHIPEVKVPEIKPLPEIKTLPEYTPPTESVPVDQNTFLDLEQRKLSLPVQGLNVGNVRNSFNEMRGDHIHEAVDIIAPRDTPVIAVEDGKIAKLFYSVRGGNTIYHFDPTETYCYYYAHLDRYAPDIREGQYIKRGQVIGYVGTSGNAPKDTPHLHFAIFKLNADKKWWQGTPIDPYPLLANQ
jgi:murein DD-endopeptidase MepM/ murein hydrolase activator NlpD